MIRNECFNCGREFIVSLRRKDSALFCSRECKHAFSRTNRECLFCGKPFVTANHMDLKYCSHKCATDSKKKRLTKKCKICGKIYEVQQYYKNSKYCSIPCRNKGLVKTLTGRFRGKASPNYKGKVLKICRYCGKTFEVHPYRKDLARYCSISCSKLDTSAETRKKIAESVKRLQKENPKIHPNYILAQKGHITNIEKRIKGELTKRGLPFEFQYKVMNYWIDFAFPEVKLAVECDGDRWHSTEEQLSKDEQKNTNLCKNGWFVFRITEQQIMENLNGCVDAIEYFIKRVYELDDTARGEGGFGSTGTH